MVWTGLQSTEHPDILSADVGDQHECGASNVQASSRVRLVKLIETCSSVFRRVVCCQMNIAYSDSNPEWQICNSSEQTSRNSIGP